jgi:hypothetical protein
MLKPAGSNRDGIIVGSGTWDPARSLSLPRLWEFAGVAVKVEGERARQPGVAPAGPLAAPFDSLLPPPQLPFDCTHGTLCKGFLLP